MVRQYGAADVAACIINLACDMEKPVSNLQLQKLLFFSQCSYLQHTNGIPLFSDQIVAWQYGPVVKSVYRTYSVHGASSITKPIKPIDSFANGTHREFVPLIGDALKIVKKTVEKWIDLPAWSLVRETHKDGGAWHYVYYNEEAGQSIEGAGYDNPISLPLMMKEQLV